MNFRKFRTSAVELGRIKLAGAKPFWKQIIALNNECLRIWVGGKCM